MKHKAFTNIIAHSCQIPNKTISLYARNLKEAGLLTSGARGVNAPEMKLLDLVRMLIALCATEKPSEAVDKLNKYRSMKSGSETELAIGDKSVGTIPAGETLEEMLHGLLGYPTLALKMMRSGFEIEVDRQIAVVHIGENNTYFFSKDGSSSEQQGIEVKRGFSEDALSVMALPFYVEDKEAKTWEEISSSDDGSEIISRNIFRPGKGGKE